MTTQTAEQYDYIVVGSGAGGGTVAARLVQYGFRVLVLEAGSDPVYAKGYNPAFPSEQRLPVDYRVPVMHTFASENSAMKWDFYVRHYANEAQQEKDPNYTKEEGGVLYPRAGCLGGCTAHNAMITVYPHNEDWDEIANITGDVSWKAKTMRCYFERLENCGHKPLDKIKAKLGINPSRHGYKGWLYTEKAIPKASLNDRSLLKTIKTALKQELFADRGKPQRFAAQLISMADPNDWRRVRRNASGVCYTPLATHNHARIGTREYLLSIQQQYPNLLHIKTEALVTRVLLDENNIAIGVELLAGKNLYRAHAQPSQDDGIKQQVYASKEVILAGGAYNTPQLLMLSGIGSQEELQTHGITVRQDLPGVGKNLQDRYEVGVANRMNFNSWEVLDNARYAEGDPHFQQWNSSRSGVYTTNGAVLAVIKKSFAERQLPDLFCFALLGKFKGYFPNYSTLIKDHLNYLTWAVLKAHTNNRGGIVKLKSADPRDRPDINFHYFAEGTDQQQQDLDAVVAGIKFVRQLSEPIKQQGLIAEEELPGEDVQTDEQLREFVADHAWGHHASCSCAIGSDDDPMAVLDSDFKVRGIKGLRVVDASVFPRIPGFFIVSAIYMIAEKAADVIAKQAKS